MTYVLSREALQVIEDIESYTAFHWVNGQAEIYLTGLFEAFARLGAQPELGRSRSDVPEPFQVYTVGSHLIVYRHNAAADRVEILTVLHPSMNIERRLQAILRDMR